MNSTRVDIAAREQAFKSHRAALEESYPRHKRPLLSTAEWTIYESAFAAGWKAAVSHAIKNNDLKQ